MLTSLLAIAALVVSTPVAAISAAQTLYTTDAAYCSTPGEVRLNQFSATYHRANQSIVVYIALDTTQANVDVTANMNIRAYGMSILNETINICDLVGGVLCPLPSLNISAYGTFALDNVDIPDIAWSVPDLEAYARLELVQPNGTRALCIQAPVTNGLTVDQPAIAIATGIFTGVALIVGLIHSAANTASPAQYRWFDILFLYQFAVATGLLNLNYPTVWRAFTRQLNWSYALFRSTPMQETIDSMRYRTGGSISGNLTSNMLYIDQASSPYNDYVNFNDIVSRLEALASALSGLGGGGGLGGLFGRDLANDGAQLAKRQAVTLTEQDRVQSVLANVGGTTTTRGIAVYTNTLRIAYPNALTTIFFFFLAFIGIFLVVHAIVFIAALLGRRSFWAVDLRRKFGLWTAGNALLLCLMWFMPLWIFGFYQFRIRDSALAIFWAVAGIVLTFIPLLVVFTLSILRSRRRSSASPGVSPLYSSFNWFHSAGALYRAYRQRFHWFWFVTVLAMIARAGFVAFGPANGWAQVIGLLVVEVIFFVALIACRPHKDRKGDWLAPFLSFCRMAMCGLLITFIPSVGVAAIPRTIVAFVLIVLVGVPTILLFFGLIWNAGYGWIWRRHTDRIEDGLEVERFVGSDKESQRPMAQNQFSDESRDSRNSSGIIGGRRTSMMEPVGNNVYDHGQGQGQGRQGGMLQQQQQQQQYSSDAYHQAATGRRGLHSSPSTRASSRVQSPVGNGNNAGVGSGGGSGNANTTNANGENRWSRDQYFNERY